MNEMKPFSTGNGELDSLIESLLEKKAENIILFNPKQESALAEWLVICNGTATIHNQAIAQCVLQAQKKQGFYVWQYEGTEDGRWIILDYSTIVVNIMQADLRVYYNLEKLWAAYPCIEITPPLP